MNNGLLEETLEDRSVIKSAGVVGGLTSFSRGLGLIRDILMAGFFGTSLPMSAWVVAFTIPNLFRRLFGEGALSAAFIPVFVRVREQEGDRPAWELARKIFTLVGLFLSVVVAMGVIGITISIHQSDLGEKAAMTLPLLRIMLPYAVFICMAALVMAVLNSYHHFVLPAFAPSLLNITLIITIPFIAPMLGPEPERRIYAVAWAVIIAGLLQWGVQLPKLRSYGFRFKWILDWKDRNVRRVFTLMGPASLGMAINQVNVVIDRLMATWIGVWAPAALYFSERLIYFPQGIFATAMSTVLLPVFSGHAARSDNPQILRTINYSIRNLFFVMFPASVGLFVLARPIVQMIFEWREFTGASTDLTAIALMFYAPGLLVFSISKVFVPAFYAIQDTRTPVKVGLISVGLKLALSLVFILTFPQMLKHAGLALATVLAETVYGVVLASLLCSRLGSPDWGSILRSALRCLAASVVMGLFTWYTHPFVQDFFVNLEWGYKPAQISAVLVSIVIAMMIYAGLTLIIRSPELWDVVGAMRRRFFKKGVCADKSDRIHM